ncbi:uncharacterized protein LOC120253895 [Dioscorea cayenensis subsp. rotundata]|uniref:Uncharacterized protein LOC120253895 n=1 Tax=Dioscorea cayennensis subsp. rotundata TaxID=55577 RepID=A0AB40AT95_DIOCR|nr:uncharacterized protein LOC120253895 [Dioscorea cayenensis subsp. rotundata]
MARNAVNVRGFMDIQEVSSIGNLRTESLSDDWVRSLDFFIFAITLFAYYELHTPYEIDVSIKNASLTTFSLFSNTNYYSLTYNLTMQLNIRNHNKHINYRRLQAESFYNGYRFGLSQLPSFGQDGKNTSTVYASFSGITPIFDDSVVDAFMAENGSGFFHIDVVLHARIQYNKHKDFTRSGRGNKRVKCDLFLPLLPKGSSRGVFYSANCR